MLTLEKLRAFGANVDEGMQRCVNNEAFYLKLVEKVIRDPAFDNLREAAGQEDFERGFELAHALKGVTANLALTPVFNPLNEITELFRHKTRTDYSPYIDTIIEKRNELLSMLP